MILLVFAGLGFRCSDVKKFDARNGVHLDRDDPVIEFEERKNGPGIVSVLVGTDLLKYHIGRLSRDPQWNGKLFTSDEADSGSRCYRWFKPRLVEICEAASVTPPSGDTPTLGDFRNFWYNEFTGAAAEFLNITDLAANAQGSSVTSIVSKHYLTAKRSRKHVLQHSGERLGRACRKQAALEYDSRTERMTPRKAAIMMGLMSFVGLGLGLVLAMRGINLNPLAGPVDAPPPFLSLGVLVGALGGLYEFRDLEEPPAESVSRGQA
jgi:hypothetical protein